jgi:hypothetical protein
MKRENVQKGKISGVIWAIVFLITYGGSALEANAAPPTETAPKILIRWNLDSGPSDTLSVRAEKTKELVQRDPDLRDLIKIELYYSNSLLKAPDAVEALIRGTFKCHLWERGTSKNYHQI